MTPDQMLVVDFDGKVLEGDGQPPSEIPIHIEILKARPDVQAVQSGNLLTVRWSIEVDELINGKMVNRGNAPRLSTFVWRDGEWKLSSHANFNLPAS